MTIVRSSKIYLVICARILLLYLIDIDLINISKTFYIFNRTIPIFFVGFDPTVNKLPVQKFSPYEVVCEQLPWSLAREDP